MRAVIFLIRRQFQQLLKISCSCTRSYTTFTNRRAFLLFFNLFWDISSTNTVISYCKSLIFPCYIGSRACIYRTNTCTNKNWSKQSFLWYRTLITEPPLLHNCTRITPFLIQMGLFAIQIPLSIGSWAFAYGREQQPLLKDKPPLVKPFHHLMLRTFQSAQIS